MTDPTLVGKGEENFIDAELSLDEVGWNLHNELARLAPFGVGNPKPVFLFRSVRPESVRNCGKSNDHVELTFKKSSGSNVPAISFFGAGSEWRGGVRVGQKIDLVASIEKSMFRNRPELRLRVVDVVLLD